MFKPLTIQQGQLEEQMNSINVEGRLYALQVAYSLSAYKMGNETVMTYTTPECETIHLHPEEQIAATSGSFGGYDEGDFDWN